MKTKLFFLLFFLVALKALLGAWLLLQGWIGLGPDEAQYWTWSQQLDWGYYSKPPGIAWQIWMGTQLFGNTELGVRFGALVIGSLLPLAVFFLGKAAGLDEKKAFWAGVVMAFCPLGILAGLLAITDGGLVLFWTLACIIFVKALREEREPSYVALGLCIALGALFKWLIYEFWVLVLLWMVFYPYLRSWKVLLGIAISLLGLLPSLYWNIQHDWVTFRHVFATIQGGHGESVRAQGNFWSFFGEQVALLSPIFFILLLGAWLDLRRNRSLSAPLRFCGLSSLLIIAGYLGLSLFQKMQGNWCDFAYPTAIVFLTAYASQRWILVGLVVSLVLTTLGFLLPYRYSPLRQNKGWERLSDALTASGYNPQEHFLVADKYQTTSLLSFYSPEQKRGYFLNLQGVRLNQFSFWPGLPEEQKGKEGFFALIERQTDPELYLQKLRPYFREVQYAGSFALVISQEQPLKSVFLFKGIDYNGTLPPSPKLY